MQDRENMKLDIVQNVLNEFDRFKDVLIGIKNGEYDYVLETDIDKLKMNIEKGEISDDLTTDQIYDLFDFDNADYLLRRIDLLKRVLAWGKYLSDKIEQEKTKMEYDPNSYFNPSRKNRGWDEKQYTYQEALDLIELARELLANDKLYTLLDFYLKNDNLIKELHEREENIKLSKKNQKVYDIITGDDNEIGIIIITDEKEGRQKKVKVVAGTKKDMDLSDFLGYPYPKDIDIERYDSPHGDHYTLAHKITKKFYNTNLSKTHLEMIELEKKKRHLLRAKNNSDELGYIPGLVISKRELLDNGFNIEDLNWKPLKIKSKRKRLFKLYRKTFGYELKNSIINVVRLNKKINDTKLKNK